MQLMGHIIDLFFIFYIKEFQRFDAFSQEDVLGFSLDTLIKITEKENGPPIGRM